MNAYNEIEEANKSALKMFYVLLFALVPLLFIVIIYLVDPQSNVLKAISYNTRSLPAIMSSNSPLLSKSMDVYVKTSPFFALFACCLTFKWIKLKSDKADKSAWQLLMLFVLFTLFYASLIYSFLFKNKELITSAKLLKLMSTNDITLSFFYVTLYAGIYMFSCLYLWIGIGICRAIKERR